eukprot:1158848-Pelagomonas_calceolata.AAC.3
MVGRPPGSAMKTYVAPGTAQRLGTASGLQDGVGQRRVACHKKWSRSGRVVYKKCIVIQNEM